MTTLSFGCADIPPAEFGLATECAVHAAEADCVHGDCGGMGVMFAVPKALTCELQRKEEVCLPVQEREVLPDRAYYAVIDGEVRFLVHNCVEIPFVPAGWIPCLGKEADPLGCSCFLGAAPPQCP